MTQIDANLSREETAAIVCEALDQAGISVVLSGGAVVSIYSDNEYESFDLDFVQAGLARQVDGVMTGLGFEKDGRHWRHPHSEFWVEFPSGPVAVGDTVVASPSPPWSSAANTARRASSSVILPRRKDTH